MTDKTDELRRAIEKAASKVHDAYWAACDAARAAVDPADVTTEGWAIDMLAESFDIALRIEADPAGWDEGREKW